MRPERFLEGAIAAARRALRERAADEVPAALRRVAGYSGGALPPPFAKSLLTWLDSDDVLRGEALGAWEGEPPSGGAQRASYVYLERGDGWLGELMVLASDQGSRRSSQEDRRLEVERDAMAAEVATQKERVAEARARADALESELRQTTREQRAPLREERAAEARLERELTDARVEVDRLRDEMARQRAELEDRLTAAQERALRHRRERAELMNAAGTGEPVVPAGGAELGRLLDRIVAAAGVATSLSVASPAEMAGASEPLRLPSSVPPDGPDAIEWVRGVSGVALVIDGYNLGFALAGLDPAMARLRVDEVVRRLGITAPSTITVVYDSSMDSDAETGSPGSVATLFSGGRSADDLIVELADRPGSVVISDDREVRERAEAVGAVALWSKAVVEWSRRR